MIQVRTVWKSVNRYGEVINPLPEDKILDWSQLKQITDHILKRILNPFQKQQILDSSKLKEFADNYFKNDENGRKFSKRVEDTVGKGEIARYEQFLLFLLCFQNTSTANTLQTRVCLGKGYHGK